MHYQSARSYEMNGDARLRTPQTTVLPFTRKMIHVTALHMWTRRTRAATRSVLLFDTTLVPLCLSVCLSV